MEVIFKKLGLYAGIPGVTPLRINNENIDTLINVDDSIAEYALASGACELAKQKKKKAVKKDKISS